MSLWEQLCTFREMSICEIIMLVCFAASWPAAIVKTWRAKNPAGKSILFAVLIREYTWYSRSVNTGFSAIWFMKAG